VVGCPERIFKRQSRRRILEGEEDVYHKRKAEEPYSR
jgi:hypothetical protein